MDQGVWRLSGAFGVSYTEMTVNTTCQPAPHKAKLTCVRREPADTRGLRLPKLGHLTMISGRLRARQLKPLCTYSEKGSTIYSLGWS